MTPIDLLIKPHSILHSALTSNGAPPDISALSGMGIAIQERHIVAIDTPARLSAQYQANQTLDLPNHLLMPGLINAQGHALSLGAVQHPRMCLPRHWLLGQTLKRRPSQTMSCLLRRNWPLPK
jgi:predicted amidohydrolase YtcJ